ncbi:MAG: dihydrolipoyl dehydrogenase [Synergistaceae bacterium]|jgi:dihydrolipoamide dehydrogenase|nr:dihydrolipoyl dehydrogenase [Synergistaceae bacterium]
MDNSAKIAVIGGGPGGYVAAIRAAQLGAEVTLIERGRLGGTCLNAGCIPAKALLQSAHLLNDIRESAEFGITAEPGFDFAQIQRRKQKIMQRLVTGVNSLFKANSIIVIKGECAFKDGHTLTVRREGEDIELAPDKIIIASGSKPSKLPIPGTDSPRCVDSAGALSFETPPAAMVIIGGGVIGVELASAYSAFGSRVTIVEMAPEILPNMDAELAGILRKSLTKRGVKILTSARLESIDDRGDKAAVNVGANGEKLSFDAEYVLVSVGRRADTESLSLAAAGINHDRGRVIVDGGMRTNLPHVYAIGDCLGQVMLAHVASAQGEVAAENAMGLDAKYNGDAVPSCVYTEPEFASVGLTEKEARDRGLRFSVGKFPLIANGRSLIANCKEGVVKAIVGEERGAILGLHILAPNATEMIAEGALAIKLGAAAGDIADTIHAHPTISEAVREAVMAAVGRAVHGLKQRV